MRSSRDGSDFRDNRHRDFRRDDRDRRQSASSVSSSSPSFKRLKNSNSKEYLNTSSNSSKSQSKPSTEPKFDCLKVSMEAMRAEEEEAINKTSGEQDLKEFRLKCNSIRDVCHQILEAKNNNDSELIDSLRAKGSLLFLSLKTLNRFDKYRCRDSKERLQSAKQKVDCFHLQLQNMLYEVMHLQKESKTCLSFKSKDESIDLIPLEEFESEADEDLKEKLSDSHSTHLARLEWELRQRQHLEEKLKSAEEVKKSCEEEIVSKRETLEKLQPMLKSIVDATQPLYSELNLCLQANDATHSLAQYLPRPLYVLYVQLISYRHAFKAIHPNFSVKINGTVDDVKTFELNSKGDEEEEENEELDDEEVRSSKKKKSRHRKSISHSNKTSFVNKLIVCHPLTVEINIDSKESTLKCVFNYLLRLEIVSLKVNVEQNPTLNHFEVLNDSVLTHLLSDSDDGLKSPNPANEHILKAYSIHEFNTLIPQIGFTYQWCQHLSGLDFITSFAKNTSNSLSVNSMDQTMKAIIERFNSRLVLQKQLCNLEHNSIDLPTTLSAQTCHNVVSQIKEFKEIHSEDFMSISRLNDEILLETLDIENSFKYRAVVERGSASLTALILIPLDYPKNPPFFHLLLGSQTERKTQGCNSSLRELEQLINCWCPQNCFQKSVSSLLSFQMHRMQLGFDIYLEANQSTIVDAEGPKEFVQKKVMSRVVTGRDHCIPFHYDSKHNIFTA